MSMSGYLGSGAFDGQTVQRDHTLQEGEVVEVRHENGCPRRLSLQGQQGLEDGVGPGTPGSPARAGGHLLPGDVVAVFLQQSGELAVVPGRVGIVVGLEPLPRGPVHVDRRPRPSLLLDELCQRGHHFSVHAVERL